MAGRRAGAVRHPASPAPRTTGCDILCVASIRAAWFARSGGAATIKPRQRSGATPRPSGVKSGEAQVLRTLRFSQLRFRRDVPPCGGMCAALIFRRFNVPAARRRPTFRRWITPGYDPGRDSFFYFLPRPSGARSGAAATIKPRQRSGATPRHSGVRSRRWITPGYDPGRDSFFLFFLFFILFTGLCLRSGA